DVNPLRVEGHEQAGLAVKLVRGATGQADIELAITRQQCVEQQPLSGRARARCGIAQQPVELAAPGRGGDLVYRQDVLDPRRPLLVQSRHTLRGEARLAAGGWSNGLRPAREVGVEDGRDEACRDGAADGREREGADAVAIHAGPSVMQRRIRYSFFRVYAPMPRIDRVTRGGRSVFDRKPHELPKA